jgi:hypothetical protein
VGRFPDTHFWRSAEAVHAAFFGVVSENGRRFLRVGPGGATYIEQILPLRDGLEAMRLQADVRAATSPASLSIHVCRKWMLTSAECRSVALQYTAQAGTWQTLEAALPALAPGQRDNVPAPIKFSVATPSAKPVIDVDNLRLTGFEGSELLVNGGFEDGMDRWFFATDVDPPWHIHNLWVSILFDQGWLGVVAWSALILAALAAGWRGLGRDDPLRIAALGGLAAFLVSGSLNTLIDAPRFLWLLLLFAALCATPYRDASGESPARRKRSRTRQS